MYCVNCGVKLADTEKNCPLCQTTVFHPDIRQLQAEPLYPQNKYPSPQVSSRGMQIILTAAFLLPMLICLQCDLMVNNHLDWADFVAASLITAYVIFILPFWFRRPNPVVFCPVDFFVIGLLLLYINYATDGNWFLSFAFPVVGFLGLLVTAVTVLLRYVRRGILYIIGGGLLALGAFMPVMEYLLYLTFDPIDFWGWSFYPLTALAIVGGTLIFLAINRRVREKMEKKFFI